MHIQLYEFDMQFSLNRFSVVGIDEAGRGPLAGPVVVAACVLDAGYPIEYINDSKKLSAALRNKLYDEIVSRAIAWSCELVDVETIDALNILQATLHGMFKAAKNIDIENPVYLVDGNCKVSGLNPQHQIIKGDSQSASIAAGSIIAKVTRDRYMKHLAEMYPQFGFDHNFGYPTPEHFTALETYGPTPHHRRSFAPVRRACERGAGYDLFIQNTD